MIDTRFKEAFTTPSVAMTLLSALMPFVKYRKENITEYLFNGDNLLGLSEEEIKETIRLLPTKEVSSSGKLTEYDVLLVYKNLQEQKDIYTINIEMQRNRERYDMLSRGIYYAARVLSNVLNIKENYDKLHKVYSIWLLDFNYFDDNLPIHSVNQFITCNPSWSALNQNIEDNSILCPVPSTADLMEIVVIELNKLERITDNDTLYNFFVYT